MELNLKEVKGGDCEDCYCKDKDYLCQSELNLTDDLRFKCSADNIHYIEVKEWK